MATARWERVKAVFYEASELPAAERADHLERACGSDLELRREVQALLDEIDDIPDGASGPTIGPVAPGRSVGEAAPGERIGPYTVVEHLGEGGFGVVFHARQDAPLRRSVALKLLKPGMDSRQVIARFEAERQALALMEHPSIARVFDGGATPLGRPYFVMELVSGVPVTRYCDQHRLPIRARLELFIEICDAVQHAHQKGVIHRDLKPSNLLAMNDSGRHRVKVIDFGIAKATQQPLTDQSLATGMQWMGTPQYMSPEQCGASADIDTRADVYSLGAVLYELLTGVTPLDSDRLRGSNLVELQRVIREEEPVRPSTRIATARGDSTASTTIARDRACAPQSLSRQLRGELDWIVGKALEKDRARRYDSVSAVAEDVRRYLRNEPVAAGPPSATYRAGKLLKRHRGAFVSAALLVATLVGGIVSTARGLQKATRALAAEAKERERAERSEQTARTEAKRSEQVSQFLKEMLSGVDPDRASGHDTTVLREILDQSAARVATELPDDPAIQASLYETIGTVYAKLALFSKAAEALSESLRLYAEVEGRRSANCANVMLTLSESKAGLSDFDAAEALARECLDVRIERFGDPSDEVAGACQRLGGLLSQRGKFEEAEAFARRAVDWRRKAPDHPSLGSALGDLASVLYSRGDFAGSSAINREALAAQERQNPEGDVATAVTLANLGNSLYYEHKMDEAESAFRRAIALRARLFGEGHLLTAAAKGGLALVLFARGALPEAAQLYDAQIEAERAAYGPDAEQLGIPLFNRGMIAASIGEFDAALSHFNESIRVLRKSFGGQHPKVAMALGGKLMVFSRQGRMDEAEPIAREVVSIQDQVPGPNLFFRFRDRIQLASILIERAWEDRADAALARRRAEEAIALMREIDAWNLAELPENHEFLNIRHIQLGGAFTVLAAIESDPQQSGTLFREAESELISGFTDIESCQSPAPPAMRAQNVAALAKRINRLYEAWSARLPDDPQTDKSESFRRHGEALRAGR